MSMPGDVIFVVHGSNAHTWWRRLANGGYPWWRTWSLFCHSMRQALGRPCEIREFRWSGINTHQARVEAGAELAAEIEEQGAGRAVHLVGHSHGGNVALAAANRAAVGRVETIMLLANPNMVISRGSDSTPEWLYWYRVTERVRLIWNLYSPEDRVQCAGVRMFHGLDSTPRSFVSVERRYLGNDHERVFDGAIRWSGRLGAHRAMHSSAVGTVVGRLLGGDNFSTALSAARLDQNRPNPILDRGGFPGIATAQKMIRERADPTPFDLAGINSEVGVLMVHGFTASASEMRPLADFIHKRTGWRCKAILLPGHGTRVEDLEKSRDVDWLAAVDKAHMELLQSCRHVFLVGLSMGAVLCCHAALNRSGKPGVVSGLVLLAPAFGLSRRRNLLLHILRRIKRVRRKSRRAAHYFLDRKLFSYLEDPLNRAAEVVRLGQQAWSNLDRLKEVPVLLVYGSLDRTVSLDWMRSAIDRNPWIRWVSLPRSRHILTVEPDRATAFETSVEFMKECLVETK